MAPWPWEPDRPPTSHTQQRTQPTFDLPYTCPNPEQATAAQHNVVLLEGEPHHVRRPAAAPRAHRRHRRPIQRLSLDGSAAQRQAWVGEAQAALAVIAVVQQRREEAPQRRLLDATEALQGDQARLPILPSARPSAACSSAAQAQRANTKHELSTIDAGQMRAGATPTHARAVLPRAAVGGARLQSKIAASLRESTARTGNAASSDQLE